MDEDPAALLMPGAWFGRLTIRHLLLSLATSMRGCHTLKQVQTGRLHAGWVFCFVLMPTSPTLGYGTCRSAAIAAGVGQIRSGTDSRRNSMFALGAGGPEQ